MLKDGVGLVDGDQSGDIIDGSIVRERAGARTREESFVLCFERSHIVDKIVRALVVELCCCARETNKAGEANARLKQGWDAGNFMRKGASSMEAMAMLCVDERVFVAAWSVV